MRRRAVLGLVLLSACSTDGAATSVFEDVFERVAVVELEEEAGDPIVNIASLTRRPGGGFIVTDELGNRVRLYGPSGALERTVGRSGDGPGELINPTAAVETPDRRIFITQRASPRLTVIRPGAEPTIREVPGLYGFWAASLDDLLVVGVGSRTDRYAMITPAGEVRATFGMLNPMVNEVPFWIYFARDRAAVVGRETVINTSFFPTHRVFDGEGDSVRTIGTAPPSWIPPTAPPVDRMSQPGDRESIEAWASSFTVVHQLAAVNDSLIVVQYGRHRPVEQDPYFVEPTTIDVYTHEGLKVVEDMPFAARIVGGGAELIALTAEPPGAWTLTLYRWRGPGP